jgi:hypothetical protein
MPQIHRNFFAALCAVLGLVLLLLLPGSATAKLPTLAWQLTYSIQADPSFSPDANAWFTWQW